MADTTDRVNVEEHDPQYEPIMKLTEQVETKTHEEDEDAIFKMRAKLFRFESATTEWKERGTGDVRLLQHKETKRVRLVMRRDKILKLCANHAITSDMKLQPNVGSDRSWVWKVAADYVENEPTAETLAIRFANSENAQQFKLKFEEAQKINAEIVEHQAGQPSEAPKPEAEETPAEPDTEPTEKSAPEAEDSTHPSKNEIDDENTGSQEQDEDEDEDEDDDDDEKKKKLAAATEGKETEED